MTAVTYRQNTELVSFQVDERRNIQILNVSCLMYMKTLGYKLCRKIPVTEIPSGTSGNYRPWKFSKFVKVGKTGK